MTTLEIFRDDEHAEEFAEGQTIFSIDDAADCMYVVCEGLVEIRIGDAVLDRVEPGGIFGEMAIIEQLPRSASAVAAAPTKISPIDRRRFLFLVDNHPFFAIEVMKVVAHRLRQTDAALR